MAFPSSKRTLDVPSALAFSSQRFFVKSALYAPDQISQPTIVAFGFRFAQAMVSAPLPQPTSRPVPPSGIVTYFAVPSMIVFASFIRITYPMAGILAALPCCGMIIVHKFPHAMRRLAMYQDALLLRPDIETAFHNYKLQESVIKGGWFGSGFWPCTGSVNPPLSYSDSFFAATVELLGVISSIPFIFIYLAWFLHCASLAHRTTSMTNRVIYLAAGSMVTTQAFIHIGVNLGLLPITGLSMPLLGTGGSAFIAFTIIITMVERLSMQEDGKLPPENSSFYKRYLENRVQRLYWFMVRKSRAANGRGVRTAGRRVKQGGNHGQHLQTL